MPNLLKPLQVDSLHYNGELNKRWGAYLLSHDSERTVLVRPHGSPHWKPNAPLWTPPGAAIEIYPHGEWYNLFFALNPGDASWDTQDLHVCYINIALPPTLTGSTLSYIDLDLDLGINSDFSYVVYDEDEFAAHAELWGYPEETRTQARSTLETLVTLVQQRDALFALWEQYVALVPREFIEGTGAALFPNMEWISPPIVVAEQPRG